MLNAFHIAAIGTRADLQRALPGASPSGAKLLKAVIARNEGDVEGAIRMMKRQLGTLQGTERAALADILAPLHVMRHENDEVIVLADILDEGGWFASAHGFRSLAHTDKGNVAKGRLHAAAAQAALETESNDLVRARVLQRLALAAFYLDEYEKASNFSLASSRMSVRIKAWRTAAAAYSIAFLIASAVNDDVQEASRFARLWHYAARKSEDESLIHQARVAEYELAVQLADDVRIELLESAMRRSDLPQQYAEHYPYAISYALVRGANDLVAMRRLLLTLRDGVERSRAEWALCTALIAVSFASENDDEAARRNMCEAVARLGVRSSSEPLHEQSKRRLARVAIAAARVLMGDDASASPVTQPREFEKSQPEESLPALLARGNLSAAPIAARGLARVFTLAQIRRSALLPSAGLTPAEFDVLRLLEKGWSAGKIARETDRSVQTIYSHTHSILGKLEASRAAEAVAIARSRGLLR